MSDGAALARRLVLDYLVHHGHDKTAAVLAESVAHEEPAAALPRMDAHAAERHGRRLGTCVREQADTAIRRAIEHGDMVYAKTQCELHFPAVLAAHSTSADTRDEHSAVLPHGQEPPAGARLPRPVVPLDAAHMGVYLQRQHYIELVRALYASAEAMPVDGASDSGPQLEAALDAARTLRERIDALESAERQAYEAELDHLVALLAYRREADVPDAAFLAPERRAELAQHLDAAILAHLGEPVEPLLASLVRQTTYVCGRLYAAGEATEHVPPAAVGPTAAASDASPPPFDLHAFLGAP